jgi:2-keto-4-pentenoate hydratase/2-oxohepta-3-ene-1,7-dioic acid hydratase in catechol pathway
MRLVSFTFDGGHCIGVVVGDEVIDLADAAPALPRDMPSFLAAGAPALSAARCAAASSAQRWPLAELTLAAPVPQPRKFLAVFLNYPQHAAETAQPVPDMPVFFNKQTSCIVGPTDPVHVPRVSSLVDYEGELAFVIGRRCRHVPAARAHEVIAGYCVANDVSARDWQLRSPTITLGKSFDTHGPLGPCLVTPDEVGDPHALRLRTWVNGDLRQDANTRDMVFDCFRQIEVLSTVCTLEPGDIVSTGTPAGIGAMQNPPRFLAAGDVVRVEIDGIGHIENRLIDEPEVA